MRAERAPSPTRAERAPSPTRAERAPSPTRAERALGIVLAHADPASTHAAFLFAAGAAALGRRVVLFASGPGVLALLRDSPHPPDAELRAACQELSVTMLACPSGLDQAGRHASDLIDGATEDGLASFLDATRDAQLISF